MMTTNLLTCLYMRRNNENRHPYSYNIKCKKGRFETVGQLANNAPDFVTEICQKCRFVLL